MCRCRETERVVGHKFPAEKVLSLSRRSLAAADLLQVGFRRGDLRRVGKLISQAGRFLDRAEAEENPQWKQVIPYAVIASGQRVFLLQRSAKGGEPRLYHRLSIGVGGHINPEPVPPDQWVEAGLRRELEEELLWHGPYKVTALGTLNDDSNAVGRVHYGLVFLVETGTEDVEVRETELLSGGFVDLDTVRDKLAQMETWSQWVATALVDSPDLLGAREDGSG